MIFKGELSNTSFKEILKEMNINDQRDKKMLKLITKEV